MPQASEKFWGAVAQMIKMVATERRLRHSSHGALREVILTLYRQTENQEFEMLMRSAERLHANFYENDLDAESATTLVTEAKILVGMLVFAGSDYMKLTVSDKDDRLDVTLLFPDSRVIDLDTALRLAGEKRWTFQTISKGIDHLDYKLTDRGTLLAGVRITHGLEPPTRVLFENRQPETGQYLKAHKRAVLAVVRDFLEECFNRGLVSRSGKENAIAELKRHDKVEV